MKKIYFLALTFACSTLSFSQSITVDFEDFDLASIDTFYNGADHAGEINSNGVIFNNYYEEFSWGVAWSGFSISNLRDDTTAGFGNQYSAFVENNNDYNQYAIYYQTDTIKFQTPVNVDAIDFCNTTYAGLSMKHGDPFSKQFGSIYNADGDIDGTDGKDYFYATLFAYDQNLNYIDSSNVYLADYTSNDTDDHYIINDWTTFQFNNLTNVSYLVIKLKSSDVGLYGMNTPAYLAMDNLLLTPGNLNTFTPEKTNFLIYPNPTNGNITLKGENLKGQQVLILDNLGKIVYQKELFNDDSIINLGHLPKGIYFVKIGSNNTKKLIVQ